MVKMFNKKNIRGFVFLIPLMVAVLLMVILAEPRKRPFEYSKSATAADSVIVGEPFEFDPNTVEYEELLALGFSKYSANALLHWRAGGKVFSLKEDLHIVRGVSDSLYFALKPYIVIGDKYRQQPRRYESRNYDYGSRSRHERGKPDRPFRIDTASVEYLATIGFSQRQAEVIVDYRQMRGGFYTMEDFARCYVVDSTMCDLLADYIIFPERETAAREKPRIEINSADSATLRSVTGIGERSVVEILEYRRRLGGFHDLNQLAEVKSVTESNFEKILTQIYCDSCNISKIDINFATQTQLDEHPYIGRKKLRKLFHKRELKGGWSRIEEMVDDGIFTDEEAEKVRPYLRFTPKAD